MAKPPTVEGVDRFVGRGLPAIRIGEGPRTLVSLPGLSLDARHPTGQARTMALTGWEPLIPLEQTLRDVLDYWREKVRVEC